MELKNTLNRIFGMSSSDIIKQEKCIVNRDFIEKSLRHENSLYCDTDIIATIVTYEKFKKYQEEMNDEMYRKI